MPLLCCDCSQIVMKWYVSSPRFTVQVNTRVDRKIIWTAPVARKFIGQQMSALVGWSRADDVILIGRSKQTVTA